MHPYWRYAQSAGELIGQGLKAYNNWSETRTSTRNKTSRENFGSTQHDSRVQYVRKRMPKRKRKRWVKFSKKVKYVIDKQLGNTNVLRNSEGTSTGWQAAVNYGTYQGPQVYLVACLYGAAGTTTGTGNTHGQDDLKIIMAKETATVMNKYRFKSACLDVTLTAIASDNNNVPLEVDIYHCIARGYGKKTDTGFNDFATVLKDTYQLPSTDPSGDQRILGLERGATLFNVPGLLSQCQWKILKKTKVFVPSGGQCTYQIRDAKDHLIRNTSFMGSTGASTMQYKGLTQFLVFMAKPIVGYVPTAGQSLFKAGITRSYTYVALDANSEATATY